MTDTSIPITPGSGANVDVFNSGTAGASRQAMVIADPVTTANAATVNAAGGLSVTEQENLTAVTGTANAAGQVVIASFDTTGNQSFVLQVPPGLVGTTIQVQHSNVSGSNWDVLLGYGQNVDLQLLDTITAPGMYSFPVVGRYIQVVTQGYVSGSATLTGYLRDAVTPNAANTLAAAFDAASPINARVSNQPKTDANNALVLSDGIQGSWIVPATSGLVSSVIDTTGYSFFSFWAPAFTSSQGIASVQIGSGDGEWTTVAPFQGGGGQWGSASYGANLFGTCLYGFPVTHRYVRFLSSGSATYGNYYLKNVSLTIGQMSVNINQLAGGTLPSSSTNAGGYGTPTQFPVAGIITAGIPGTNYGPAYGSVTSPLYNVFAGSNNAPYPVGIAGVDLNGYLRRPTTDIYGQLQIVPGTLPNAPIFQTKVVAGFDGWNDLITTDLNNPGTGPGTVAQLSNNISLTTVAPTASSFSYTGSVTTNSATPQLILAAQGVGQKIYVTGIQAQNTSATVTTILLQDAKTPTTTWQASLPASMTTPMLINFPTPLVTGVNANYALNAAFGTSSATVLLNVQGFVGN